MMPGWVSTALFLCDLILRIYFCVRIIQRRLPVGVAWAWIGLIVFFPFAGTVIYFYLGEYRLGRRRTERLRASQRAVRKFFASSFKHDRAEELLPEPDRTFALAVRGFFGSPFLKGNEIRLLPDSDSAFRQMILDVGAAQASIDMEFYIWSDGGCADDFGEAVIRACARGVKCRLLVDQIGSRSFLAGPMRKKLEEAGVELCAALPSGIIRSFFARPDLRIHRKIVVVDGAIAYTGSLNLADRRLFKRKAHVGQWVDSFCRVKGSAVQALGLVFLSDWCVELDLDFEAEERKSDFKNIAQGATADIQCLPSGPAIKNSAIEQVLVMAMYTARHSLTFTTPYFVPDEIMLYALIASAKRGVKVTLIVPAQVDSRMIQYAGRAFLRDLVEAGVCVALYEGGMLHTKSVTVDGSFCLYGSLNLDPRSLRINFEISLAIYDDAFVQDLTRLQRQYLAHSTILTVAACDAQGWRLRLKENLARLAGPIL